MVPYNTYNCTSSVSFCFIWKVHRMLTVSYLWRYRSCDCSTRQAENVMIECCQSKLDWGIFSEKQTTLFLSQACKADSEASWMDFWWAWIDLGSWINRLSMSPCTATTRKIEFRNISVASIAFLSPRLSLANTQNHLPQVWSWLTFSQSNLISLLVIVTGGIRTESFFCVAVGIRRSIVWWSFSATQAIGIAFLCNRTNWCCQRYLLWSLKIYESAI